MALDLQSLLQAISSDKPAGDEVNEAPDYQAIATQIDQLTRADFTGTIDWEKIQTQASQILLKQSKDFLVAGWVAVSWVELQGVTTIKDGANLFIGMLTQYWDDGFPPVARIRGRRNAIAWWADQVSAFIARGNLQPLPQDQYDAIQTAVKELDKTFAGRDPDAPSLGDFIQLVGALEIQPEPTATPTTTPAATPVADVAQGQGGEAATTPAPAPIAKVDSEKADATTSKNLLASSLLEPISEAQAAGAESRDGPDYQAIATQIDQLTRADFTGTIDWEKIQTQASQILLKQSKDFLVAGWVAVSWVELQGVTTIKDGANLFIGMLTQYWDDGFPPVARIRGRRNAIAWWADQVSAFIARGNLQPLPQDQYDAIQTAVKELDKTFAGRDPDAPSLGDFIQLVGALEIQPEPTATPTTTPAATPVADVAQGQGAPTSQSTLPAGPVLNTAVALSNLDAIATALDSVRPYVGTVAQALLAINKLDPLVIVLGRFSARASIMELPPANAGATSLPEPPFSELQMFNAVTSANDPNNTIEFCESRIAQYPYWLDLDYFSAKSYEALGESAVLMKDAVVDSALSFIARLEGVENLSFAGKTTPFASSAAQKWLADCRLSRSGGNGPLDALAIAKSKVLESAGGSGDGVIKGLQAFIDSTRSPRDQFRARIELLALIFGFKKGVDISPLTESLVSECEERKLANWEPELALAAWNLRLQSLQQALMLDEVKNNPDKVSRYQEDIGVALSKISYLSYSEAIRGL